MAESTTTRSNDPINEKEVEKDKEIESQKEPMEDGEIVNLLKNLNIETEDLLSLINSLIHFNYELYSLKDISLLLTTENFNILKKLNEKNNIKINLILSQIYMNIINNDSLYSIYLIQISQDKINLLLQIIDEIISLTQKLSGFVFDPELFNLKTKLLSLIKSLSIILKTDNSNNKENNPENNKNEPIIRKLQELLDTLPTQFFSETYNELNQERDYFDILRTIEQYKINNFEDKFAQINNYYEQFDAFRTFVRCNSGVISYAQVSGGENSEISQNIINVDENTKIEFYHQYGLLILKFCKYHQYIFVNKKNKESENKEGEEEENDVRVVFLLDKIKHPDDDKTDENEEKKEEKEKEDEKKEGEKEDEKKEEKEEDKKEENEEKKEEEKIEDEKKKEEEEKKKEEEKKEVEGNNPEQNEAPKNNKKIENMMNEKLFISVTESKEYNELIKKEINNYLNTTKNFEKYEKIKQIRDQMSYYLSVLDVESYVPLYLTDFSKITISDNFTPSFLTNVTAGQSNELYLETRMNGTMLVYVEFGLEDKSKDITFEVNKYEINTNTFKSIYKEEKIEENFKFFILCSGYSLYQIKFDNTYSWFTSKDVNYRFALLRLIDRAKKEEENNENKNENEDKKEDEKEDKKEEKKDVKEEKEDKKEEVEEKVDEKFYCYFNGKNTCFNSNEICKKIKDFEEKKEGEEIINIPVILYLNKLRIVSIKKDENGKEQIAFIEKEDEDEKLVQKHTFEYQIIKYLKKTFKINPKDTETKKVIISIFSENRDLSTLFKEVEEQIKALNVSTINNSLNDTEYANFLEKIGFYPREIMDGYKVEYRLYDLCEQSLIYHLFLSNTKNIKIKKSILFLQFDKLVVNAAVFNEGAIFTKLKSKKEKDVNWKSSYFSNINTSDESGILDFFENANDTFENIDLVLSYVDYDDEKKKADLLKLFDKIKKHCQEKINPPVKVYIYDQKEIANNVFNYINLFYNN